MSDSGIFLKFFLPLTFKTNTRRGWLDLCEYWWSWQLGGLNAGWVGSERHFYRHAPKAPLWRPSPLSCRTNHPSSCLPFVILNSRVGCRGSRCSTCRLQLNSLTQGSAPPHPRVGFSSSEAVLCITGCSADPWPLTIRCQKHPHVVITKNVSRYWQIPPGGGGGENRPCWRSMAMVCPGSLRSEFLQL